ncbi:MAG: dienelactone hydrolase family protein [Bacteroidales bacterium]|nr:dienelactone hydrolase family protein [Bacteroidales bacterium]
MKKIVFLTTLILFTITLFSQNHTLTLKQNVINNGYNFWIYTPYGYDTLQEKTPLIIFLHGASLCGNNPDKVLRYGPLHAINMGRRIDAIVLAPQNPGGSWQPKKINDVLEWVKTNYKSDTNRIYVIGMSLGCYGTLDYAATYPDKIAAAMAICGGTTMKNYDNMAKLPLWILHGTNDKAVPHKYTKVIADYLKSQKKDGRFRYDLLQGESHTSIAKVLYLKKTYEWLLSHNLQDENREVNRNISIKTADLKNAYSDMSRNAKKPTVRR